MKTPIFYFLFINLILTLMKSLKILTLLCIISGFISNNVNSQPVRTDRQVLVRWNIPCVHEVISGWVIFHSAIWNNTGDESNFPLSKQQVKYEGTLIGQISHLEYTIDFIANTELHDPNATSTTLTRTILIRQDGKLVARLPITAHMTINANGEETVDFNESDIDCK